MPARPPSAPNPVHDPLEVCFLPELPWDDALRLQQRLVYELGEAPRRRAMLLVAEHPPIITVGRQGSHGHILGDFPNVPVRWTNRGGGVWFQGPGQLAVYLLQPLDPERPQLDALRGTIYAALVGTLREFDIPADRDPQAGVAAHGKQIAAVGLAVKSWVSYHGAVLNVCLPPERLRAVRSAPRRPERLETCMLRERVLPLRMSAVRESLARNFAAALGREYHLVTPAKVSPAIQAPRDHANVG